MRTRAGTPASVVSTVTIASGSRARSAQVTGAAKTFALTPANASAAITIIR
jgi:hypothetical protein